MSNQEPRTRVLVSPSGFDQVRSSPGPFSGAEKVVAVLRGRLVNVAVPLFELRFHDGSVYRLGGNSDGDASQHPVFAITVRNRIGARALASLDELPVGESYLRGDLDVEGDFLAALDLRRILSSRHPVRSLARFLVPLLIGQGRSDRAWVPRHYDFGNEFYWGFLDKAVGLYSQALYRSENESLEQAVRNKLDYITDICRLRPGSHVLDVGGGWGALGKYLGAKGINVTMLTISREQYKYLRDWTANHGLPCRLKAVYESIFAYNPREQYDAITLLGVMEHLPDYPKLFARIERLLRVGGRLYMDFAAGRRKFNVGAFVCRYVFPGNHSPVYLPGLLAAANRSSFEPIALHNDRHSYYLTLQAWARNLEAAKDQLVARVGEQVFRLFQLFLWGGANLFLRDGSLESYRIVFQRSSGLPSSHIGV